MSANNKEKLTQNNPGCQNTRITRDIMYSVYQHCAIIASENNYNDPDLQEHIITFKEHTTHSYNLT